MRRPISVFATLAFVISIPSEAEPPQSSEDAYVVLISLDGFTASRLEDDELELPNLRAVARAGAWAKSSHAVFPSTHHPAHTSIPTGVPPRVHGVIDDRMRNRVTGEYFQITNKPRSESVKVPTLFDAAKRKGYRTASFFWPENRDDPAVGHSIPFVLTGEMKADIRAADPVFLEELRESEVPIDLFFDWYDDLPLQVTSDRILTRAAVHVIEKYKPQLLAIRLPAMDRYQHEYGPDHYLAKAAFTAADYNVGLIRRASERRDREQNDVRRRLRPRVPYDRAFRQRLPFIRTGGSSRESRSAPSLLVRRRRADRAVRCEKASESLDRVFEQALALEGISRVIRPTVSAFDGAAMDRSLSVGG